ncbi:MAG: 5-formyltetrahydrofolate cyclo-ligase [Phenylobacterium sp.]|nr:5-formyltetrahydrofolate cyclo-ligase [Phenylobacterium sp.]
MTPVPDKTALRVRLRGLRRRLAAELPDAARRAAERLPLDRLPPYRVFSLYHPLGSEMDPAPLLDELWKGEAKPTLPVAVDRHSPLIFRLWNKGMRLEPDAFGIPAPVPIMPALTPDLVIAPVLGFDRRGHRLGQGAGHYDRTIANLRSNKSVFVIGLAYSGQEVAELPAEPHDERLDAILTETDYIEVG